MRTLASLLLLTVLGGCSTTGTVDHGGGLVYGDAESVDMSAERLERIAPVMQDYVDDGTFPGIVSMVARQGQVVHLEAFGELDVESGTPMSTDSIFRIYSMSKPITTVAAMMLYEEGKFQLDDPVEDYLPAFRNAMVLDEDGELEKQEQPFTIRNLMTHTAGLTYGVFGDSPVDRQYRRANILGNQDLEEMVEKLGDIPLQYQPGIRWHYSVATDVLGRLVEVLSGQPLDQFFEQRVFQPLSMQDTSFDVPEDKLDRFGTNHRYNPQTDELEVADPAGDDSEYVGDVTFFSGGGGLLSTAEDYMKFSQMLLNGGEFKGARLLSRKTVDYMTRNHLDGILADRDGESAQSRPGQGFGLGFGVVVDATESGVVSSEGEYNWGGAAGTVFWIDPVEELIAIVMVQHMNTTAPLRGTMKALTYGAIAQ